VPLSRQTLESQLTASAGLGFLLESMQSAFVQFTHDLSSLRAHTPYEVACEPTKPVYTQLGTPSASSMTQLPLKTPSLSQAESGYMAIGRSFQRTRSGETELPHAVRPSNAPPTTRDW
jgi:hypothetical protein